MLPPEYALPAAALLMAGGALACFFGLRLFRIVLAIYGFVLGALVSTSVLAPVGTTTVLVTTLVGGMVGATILVLAYFAGVAFAGAALAAVLVHVVWGQFGAEPNSIVVVVACVAGALAAASVQQLVIVAATAYGGSWTLLAGLLALTGQRQLAVAAGKGDLWLTYPLNPVPGHWWVKVAWLALGTAGLLVQLKLGRGIRTAPRVRAKKGSKAAVS
jgi:hypothetical protein